MITCALKVEIGFMSRGAREKETHYGGLKKIKFFGVAVYRSSFRLKNFKMADPIWQSSKSD